MLESMGPFRRTLIK